MFYCTYARSSSELLLGLWPIDTVELGTVMSNLPSVAGWLLELLAGGSASNVSLGEKQLKLGLSGPLGLQASDRWVLIRCYSCCFVSRQGSSVMALRALKFASLTAAASGVYLYGNKFLDPNDFGIVRVGRAIATVSSTIAMYRKIPRWVRELKFTRTWDFLHSLSAFSVVSWLRKSEGPWRALQVLDTVGRKEVKACKECRCCLHILEREKWRYWAAESCLCFHG